jgi:hypothetical protein
MIWKIMRKSGPVFGKPRMKKSRLSHSASEQHAATELVRSWSSSLCMARLVSVSA